MKNKKFPVQAWHFPQLEYSSIEAPINKPREEIARAEEWLFNECGSKKIYAPLGKSTWYSYRATLPNLSEPMFYGETNFDPQIWIDAGYKVAARYISALAKNQPQIFSAQKRKSQLEELGWRIEVYNPNQEGILKRCHEIANLAFVDAFCFQPIVWEEFQNMYQPLLQNIDPRLVLIARSPEGVVAGFCLSYPDDQSYFTSFCVENTGC